MTKEGKPSGMCYVELDSQKAYDMAMKKNREKIRDRYIEC